jgi:hypothetical protein
MLKRKNEEKYANQNLKSDLTALHIRRKEEG